MAQKQTGDMPRTNYCKETFTALFGGEALTGEGPDPEFMDILQKYIFGEVFAVGELDHRTRELITCTTLSVLQTLPQLKAHTAAALRTGVTPVELREAIYLCAPYIGFPRTLNAVATINAVFAERGIALPLEAQGTVTEETRTEQGAAIRRELGIGSAIDSLPNGMEADVERFLTAYGFGDIYTRKGLEVKQRTLLAVCILTALGDTELLSVHLQAALRAGNDWATLTAAVIQCMPYVGFPAALKALRTIRALREA